MTARSEVLIASADVETRRTLAGVLSQWGLEPLSCSTVGEAQAILARQAVPLVFCEDCLTDGSFRDLLSAVLLAKPQVRVALISRMGDRSGHLKAIQLGAFDAIPCPCRLADVQRVIFRAMSDGQEPNGLEWEIT